MMMVMIRMMMWTCSPIDCILEGDRERVLVVQMIEWWALRLSCFCKILIVFPIIEWVQMKFWPKVRPA